MPAGGQACPNPYFGHADTQSHTHSSSNTYPYGRANFHTCCYERSTTNCNTQRYPCSYLDSHSCPATNFRANARTNTYTSTNPNPHRHLSTPASHPPTGIRHLSHGYCLSAAGR